MRTGTLIAGRFEILSSGKFEATLGVDRETGGTVQVISIPDHYFLDQAAIEHQAKIVAALADPTLIPPVHVDPLVIPTASDEPKLEHAALIDATLELVAAVGRAWRLGVCVDPSTAWIDQAGALRLPAPSAVPGLHFQAFGREREWMVGDIQRWLEQRLKDSASGLEPGVRKWLASLPREPDGFARGLSERAGKGLELWPAHVDVALDFDRGIELGEAKLRRGLGRFERGYANMPLAAAYHHRACVRWRDGQVAGARADVTRACELDPHARYLTSAALMADGDPGSLHDAAVAALEPKPDPYRLHTADPQAAKDAGRTLHARAAYRAGKGEDAGAIADLELSLAQDPSPGAQALLDRLRQPPA